MCGWIYLWCIYIYVCMYVCMHACMYVCICICPGIYLFHVYICKMTQYDTYIQLFLLYIIPISKGMVISMHFTLFKPFEASSCWQALCPGRMGRNHQSKNLETRASRAPAWESSWNTLMEIKEEPWWLFSCIWYI